MKPGKPVVEMKTKPARFTQADVYANVHDWDKYQQHIPKDAVQRALESTHTESHRDRRLPHTQLVALIIAMSMFRHLAIETIASMLRLAKSYRGKFAISSGAIAKARKRLGPEPLKALFDELGPAAATKQAQSPQQCWRGLSLWVIDGSTLRLPDSKATRSTFGLYESGLGRCSGYPVARWVLLMAVRSHLVAQAVVGPISSGELELAGSLWSMIPSHSLTLLDRHFVAASVRFAINCGGENRHWLMRLRKDCKYRILKKLGNGDHLAELRTTRDSLAQNSSLPKTHIVRVLSYQVPGYRPQKLMTSLIDAETYPRDEVAAQYHARWEVELGLREIKSYLFAKRPALRSKSIAGIEQEFWGGMLAYHMIRSEACVIAMRLRHLPQRLGFVGVRESLRVDWVVMAHTQTSGFVQSDDWYAVFLLPRRRVHRRYPRAVKATTASNFPSKSLVKPEPIFPADRKHFRVQIAA